ncbi:MAG: hypothetical protein WBD27_01635 [Pyrinomonadaceae bacterium]
MTKFIGICEMFAVPGKQKIAFMIGSQRQVQSVALRIVWHNHIRDVEINYWTDHLVDRNLAF